MNSKPPAPTIGVTSVPSGEWAHRAQEFAVKVTGVLNTKRRFNIVAPLFSLSLLDLRRESTMRDPTERNSAAKKATWTGLNFQQLVSFEKSHAEGVLAQATGKLLEGDSSCMHCSTGTDNFDGCIRVPAHEHCTNCHYGRQSNHCSLRSDSSAPGPTATSGQPEANMPTSRGELQGLLVQAMKHRYEFLRLVDNVLGQRDTENESIGRAIHNLI
ncbi:hypothetical protein N7520_004406 [Penicillium odoratum]|uniref:uncharacterized protein n=1 Tax=Penicillium odoratum TaxID=1167516 RepID=UPI00254677A1|nr:uncharacterized protein N7520_004406 [Penicillium odoratum]KAJ5764847.1 hypothetical protein N7520_004406 [Penicillium odoratum]